MEAYTTQQIPLNRGTTTGEQIFLRNAHYYSVSLMMYLLQREKGKAFPDPSVCLLHASSLIQQHHEYCIEALERGVAAHTALVQVRDEETECAAEIKGVYPDKC